VYKRLTGMPDAVLNSALRSGLRLSVSAKVVASHLAISALMASEELKQLDPEGLSGTAK